MDKNKDLSYSFYLGGVLLPACVLCFNFNFFEFDLLIVGILLLEALVYTFLKSKLKHATLYSYVFLGGLSTSLFSVIRIGFMNVYNTIALDYSYVLGFSLNKFTINGQSLSQINLSSLIFLVIFFSIFIGPVYRYTINKKSNGKTFLITLGMSLPNFIVQIHLNWFFVLFLFIYWACLVLPSLKMYFPKKIRWRQIRVVSLTIIISSCLVFVSLPETKFKEMYAPVSVQKNIMDQINEWIQHLSFIQYQQDAVDLTTAGNRVYADIVHFEVENRNKKDIYFKTFSGSVYGENKWDILPKKNYDDSYDNRLIDFHHLISLIRVQRIMELPNYAYEQIKIVDHRRGDSYALQPYFINKIDQEYREVFDYAIKIGSDEVNYQIWNEENEEYFLENSSNYYSFVEENYLQVPIMHTKAFPNELNLKYSYDMKEDFLETIDDQKHLPIEYYFSKEYSSNFTEEYISYVADYIRSFLKKYEYTLKPGATPKDKDFVNYFLLENKKGYCVHFASAATLMFRYYGIPARYVEGYHVSSNQYNDYNIADVLDSDAHAWVEVYSLRKGWYPIEVTVGYIADEPDAPDLPVRPNPDQPENPNRPNNTQPVTPDNPNLPKEPEKQSKIKIDWKIMFTMLLPVSIILVYFGIRMITLRRRYRRFNSDNRQEAVYAMATYLSIIDQKYPILNDSVIAIFEKNKFSNHLISDEEMIQVKEVIEKDVKELYSSLEFKQKIKFKYIKLWL